MVCAAVVHFPKEDCIYVQLSNEMCVPSSGLCACPVILSSKWRALLCDIIGQYIIGEGTHMQVVST